MTQTLGIDFAWARPNPAAVWGAGYRFVMGYLSAGGSKDLTAASIAAYRAAGLQVGLVWETTANRALSDAAGGAADGAAAEAEANRVGYPPDCVIFAAVDFAATVAQIDGPIRAYMLAFSAATRRPVGVYGSYDVVSRLVTPGSPPVSYGWQTMAWSGSQLWQPGHLYQRLSHTYSIAGSPVTDWDENVLLNPLPLAGSGVTPGGDVPLTNADVALLLNYPAYDGGPSVSQVLKNLDLAVADLHVWMRGDPTRTTDSLSYIAQLISQVQAASGGQLDAKAVATLVLAGLNGAQINVAAPPA